MAAKMSDSRLYTPMRRALELARSAADSGEVPVGAVVVHQGVIVGEGSVVAMGVFITQSTKIVHRDSGEVIRGHIPPYSVVVPGTMPGDDGRPGLACAVIVKTVDAQTREKTAINDLLRD